MSWNTDPGPDGLRALWAAVDLFFEAAGNARQSLTDLFYVTSASAYKYRISYSLKTPLSTKKTTLIHFLRSYLPFPRMCSVI